MKFKKRLLRKKVLISLLVAMAMSLRVFAPLPVAANSLEAIEMVTFCHVTPSNSDYHQELTLPSEIAYKDYLDVNQYDYLGPCMAPVAGDLIITEIMQNPKAVNDSEGEWFEIYNNAGRDINLSGLIVKDNSTNKFTVTPIVIPSGNYFVFAKNGDSSINGGVIANYDYPDGFTLANNADEVILIYNGVEIDRVEYDGGPNFPSPEGASMILGNLLADNNIGGNWCVSSSSYGAGDLGTPGAVNDSCGEVLSFCGDGITQEPNDEGIYEQCDGVAGCNNEICAWIPLEPVCQESDRVILNSEIDQIDMDEEMGAEHNLQGWSANRMDGNYGGYNVGGQNYRQVWEPECAEENNDAYFTMHFGDSFANKLIINSFDSVGENDSYSVYYKNSDNWVLIGHYYETLAENEAWEVPEFNLPNLTGEVEFKIIATDSKEVNSELSCDNYGQISISWISASGFDCGDASVCLPGYHPTLTDSLDEVDMGEEESGKHNLSGWTENRILGDYGGYYDQGLNYRQVWGGDCDQEDQVAYFSLDAGSGYADTLIVHALDDVGEHSSYRVYYKEGDNWSLIGDYSEIISDSEAWLDTSFNLPNLTGLIEFKIEATDEAWSFCGTYGQISVHSAKISGISCEADSVCGNGEIEEGEDCENDCDCEAGYVCVNCQCVPAEISTASICGYKYKDSNKNQIFDNDKEKGLAGWTIQLKQLTACEADEDWADAVISYVPGLLSDGVTPIPAEQADPTKALGKAEDDDTINFVSLGIGGELILEFDNYIINGDGDDLEVVETTFGNPACESSPEYIRVYASQTGADDTWIELGEGCLDSKYDLGSLSWARYVKIVDETNPADFGDLGDGFDVDGVRAIHGANWELIETQITDESGYYCFNSIKSGDYRVEEVIQPEWTNSTPVYQDVTITPEDNLSVNFGNLEIKSEETNGDVDEGRGSSGGGGIFGLYIHTESIASVVQPESFSSVIISWFTNIPANSRVIYGTELPNPLKEAPNYGFDYSTETTDNNPKVTYHTVTINNLLPNTLYYFVPISAASPEVLGEALMFTTGEAGPEVLEEPEEESVSEPLPPLPKPAPSGPTSGTATDAKNSEDSKMVILAEDYAEEGVVEATSTAEVVVEDTATSEEESELPTCNNWIWTLLLIALFIAVIIYYREEEKSNVWAIFAVLIIVPAVIWHPACWLITWLLIIAIIEIIYLFFQKKLGKKDLGNNDVDKKPEPAETVKTISPENSNQEQKSSTSNNDIFFPPID